MEAEPACALAEKEEENQRKHSLFRYRDSPEEIQGEASVNSRAEKTLIPIEERLGEKQGEEGSQHKEGAKGDIVITLDDAQGDQADADDRTSERADHNGEERRLPAKKRTDHRQQLDIATSHSLLAEKIGAQPGQEPEDAASHGETEPQN